MSGQGLARRTCAVALSAALCVSAAIVGAGASAAASSSGSGGTVKWGLDLSQAADGPIVFDPTQAQAVAAQEAWLLPIYDSLLRTSPNGSLVPGLASSVTVVNGQTLSVRLRAGVKFSDGAPFDAEAVKAGILRNEEAPNHGQFSTQLYDLSSIDVDSPLSLTIHLSQPVAAAFYPLLAAPETYIVSPRAATEGSVNLNTAPVGAGPFLLKRYVPNEEIVLVKNPTYFAASSIKVHEIDIVSVPTGPQQVDALEAGQIDTGQVPLGDLATVKNGSFNVQTVQSVGSMVWMPICKTTAPFDNARVRQALSYGIDRKAINVGVLQGTGAPQWSLWPPGNRLAPKALDRFYAYNPKKARQLLAQAGHRSLSASVLVLPGVPVLQRVAQVLQAQWKAIGVTLTIGESSNFVTDLYTDHEAPLGLISEIPAGPTGLQMLDRLFVPGAIGDLCNYNNPALDTIATQLNAATPASPQYTALWNAAQQIIVKQGLAIFLNALPIIEVSDAKLKGNPWLPSTFFPILNYWQVSVR
jgi:peptide/nickel transport system substrate-binding protein